jgi:UDP-N-acetyl-D-glucosamine dehydrogenase
MKIAIVGLGYVGLPLSLQFAQSGVSVLGLDIDPIKVKKLNAGQTYIKHVMSEAIQAELDGGRFSASGNFALIREMEAVIICVPTPLNKNREPAPSSFWNRPVIPGLRMKI